MNIQQMSCPNCGASISVAEDLNQLSCTFCGSTLNVQRGEGYAALKIVEKLGQAIQDSNTQTQGTIREGTQVTQIELKRLQINQDLTMAQLHLSNVQTEIRSLERETATRKISQQLRELRQQEISIKSRIATLQAALQPQGNSSVPVESESNKLGYWYESKSRVIFWLIFFFLQAYMEYGRAASFQIRQNG